MNKKSLIAIIVAIVLLICIVVAVVVINNNKNTPKNLELTYTTNGGVPYEWQYEIYDSSIVEFVESKVVEDKNKNGMVGAPIKTKYIFKGLKKGTTTITFKYVNIVDGTVDKTERSNIEVDKNKNIKLINHN